MKRITVVIMSVFAVAFFAGRVISAEHPGTHEHPGKEHAGKEMGASASAAEIIKAIKDHITEVTDAHNGFFPLYDEQEARSLKLKLVKVHEDKVSYIKKDNAYFACTDFITDDGTAGYDVDFWMKKTGPGAFDVYMTKVHKKDGKPRFTYKDDEIVPVK